MVLTENVFSLLPLLLFLNLISNTPDIALPYSAGKALVIKSELANNCALNIDMPPPEVPTLAKWFGLGISIQLRLQLKLF